ncbi:unnamed protein product [Microthlaspi erraticum]|uniref:Uncharacterized protein n=1 Tax=Microthlaspi erraticum TaxID=1685480 RepID=A0A6D2HUJ1_9BRAS|nr:unnamed protein product [Microthlaspi erraticum]
MRGGSMFGKYCRKGISSGSRHYSSSSKNSTVRQVEEAPKPRFGLGFMIVYGFETAAFKAFLVWAGYRVALVDSPYDPEKFASDMEALAENRLLDEKWKVLEKKHPLTGTRMEHSN